MKINQLIVRCILRCLKPGYLSKAQWSEGEIDKIEKDFKLTTTKQTSLTNIRLYNENNTITRS